MREGETVLSDKPATVGNTPKRDPHFLKEFEYPEGEVVVWWPD